MIYDKIAENHIFQLDKGLQINLNKNYNPGMKMKDSVIKELIEGVGENVKTFKYAGNHEK